MANNYDGGPAFPMQFLDSTESGGLASTATHDGMNLIDYFAGQAIVGLIASDPEASLTPPKAAGIAYGYAAALVAEKKRREASQP